MPFFSGINAVYSKVGRAASEECVLALLQAKCLPILLYEQKHARYSHATGRLLNSL